jgi:hypothetical protein
VTFDAPWGNRTPKTQIVVIGVGMFPGDLEALFDRCIADRPAEEIESLAGLRTVRI